ARFHRHLRWQDDLAVVHREHPAHQPLCRGGDRVRPWPQIPYRPHRDRGRHVSDWARSHDVPHTGFTSLATSADVVRLIGAEIERANGELSRVEQIKDFRILPKALDPEEEGEPVTPTRKVKRHLMYERFKTLVEGMYDDREQRLIAASAVASV